MNSARRLVCLLPVLLSACGTNNNAPTNDGTEVAAAAAPADRAAFDYYGDGTELVATVAVGDVLARPQAFAGQTLRIRGPIVSTCANKGCWMRLGSEADNVFVKFKDYGFFVPTGGVEGRDAVVDGVVSITTQSVDEVKHYLEDAGRIDEAAKVTEPRTVVSVMATGVAIHKGEAAAKE